MKRIVEVLSTRRRVTRRISLRPHFHGSSYTGETRGNASVYTSTFSRSKSEGGALSWTTIVTRESQAKLGAIFQGSSVDTDVSHDKRVYVTRIAIDQLRRVKPTTFHPCSCHSLLFGELSLYITFYRWFSFTTGPPLSQIALSSAKASFAGYGGSGDKRSSFSWIVFLLSVTAVGHEPKIII